MKGLRLLWLGLVLALSLAACANGGGSSSDDAKNRGFYGGTNGGWTQLQQQ